MRTGGGGGGGHDDDGGVLFRHGVCVCVCVCAHEGALSHSTLGCLECARCVDARGRSRVALLRALDRVSNVCVCVCSFACVCVRC